MSALPHHRLVPAALLGARFWRRALCLALMLSPATASRAVWAAGESAASPSAATEVERAQALFDEARALMQEGKYAEACPKLEESQRLDPGLGTQFNLGACYEATGRRASAYALFVEVAAIARERGQTEREQVARQRADAVEQNLSKLSIVVSPDQVERVQVERDGIALAPDELGVAVPVDSGRHQIRAHGAGLVEWSTEIVVPEEARVHTLVVPPLAERRLAPTHSSEASSAADGGGDARSFWTPTHHKVGVAAGGLGVLGIAVGSVFALRAISLSDESDELGCLGNLCPTAEALEKRNDAQTAGNVATISMITGLTGLATAAVLFLFVDGDSDHAALPLVPRAAAGEGELIWQGRF